MKSGEQLDHSWARNFNATEMRRWLKEQAVAQLGGKCRCCGYDKSLAALDFHHRDPRQKDFEISSKMSWESIEPELRKCVLLCRNCHAETHAGLHPQFIDTPREEDVADEYDLYVAAV